jgi:molybdopterin synthase sulfur carrier subunit
MATSRAPADHFTLLYFASAASYTTKESEFIAAPLPLSNLFDHLDHLYPGIKIKVLTSCAVTLNTEYVDIDDEEGVASEDNATKRVPVIIQAGDEVAIIPPVSSG